MQADVPWLSLPGIARLFGGAISGLASDHNQVSLCAYQDCYRLTVQDWGFCQCLQSCLPFLFSFQCKLMIMFINTYTTCVSSLLSSPVTCWYAHSPSSLALLAQDFSLFFLSFGTFFPPFFFFPLLKGTSSNQPLTLTLCWIAFVLCCFLQNYI